MATVTAKMAERKYYVDWLRILLILSVFMYHIGMIFNSWDWHVKNDVLCEYKSTLWYIMVFLGRWRMPLLILISGAGTYLALGKRTSGQYLGERFKRLFIPLAAGIFILVPVQVYIEKSTQYNSLVDYYPHMFEGIYPSGNFSWHHLWFIAYLFFIALIISPFLNFMRGERFNNLISKITSVVSKKSGANIFLIPLILSQLMLRPLFPDQTHALVDDWAYMVYFILFFLSGFIIISRKKILNVIKAQRNLFFIESCIAATIMFTIPYKVGNEILSDIIWIITEITVAWSAGMAAIGYAYKYLNFDNKFRKLANEAIYPFYLLHQPIIIVTAFFIVPLEIPIWAKAFIITIISFVLTVAIYWYLVRSFNVMRIIFGMKPITAKSKTGAQKEGLRPLALPVKTNS